MIDTTAMSSEKNSAWPPLSKGVRVAFIIVATLLTMGIALETRPNVHPDEYVHSDGFRYFEQAWWPPEPGYEGVIYSPYGWSRVYTGELVYLIYGKIGAMVGASHHPYLFYRLFNVALFSLTLTALFFSRCRWFNPTLLAMGWLCVPQLHYLYAYANSDAWGLSMSLFLFLLVMNMVEQPPASWRWSQMLLLGLFTGLLLSSKLPFLMALPLPYALLGWVVWRARAWSDLWLRLIGAALIALLITLPLTIIYPLSVDNYAAKISDMRHHYSVAPYQDRLYSFAAQGESYLALLRRDWAVRSMASWYGDFGYSTVSSPTWAYLVAWTVLMLNLALSAFTLLRRWGEFSPLLRLSLLLSPWLLLLNVVLAFDNSYHSDFQPQGRYLYGTWVCLMLLLVAPTMLESGIKRQLRGLSFGLLYGVCLFILLSVTFDFRLSKPLPERWVAHPFDDRQPVYHAVDSHLMMAGIQQTRTPQGLQVRLIWQPAPDIHLPDYQHHAAFVELWSADESLAREEVSFQQITPLEEGQFATDHLLPVPPPQATLRIGAYQTETAEVFLSLPWAVSP